LIKSQGIKVRIYKKYLKPSPIFFGIILGSIFPFSAGAIELPELEAVPGGVFVIPLDETDGTTPPTAKYKKKNVMVVRNDNQWLAVVGIPLSAKPGTHKISVFNKPDSNKSYSFDVADKAYETQHLTIKNKRKVNPNADDMKRITKEKKRITNALAYWNNRLITNELVLDLPLDGRLSSSFGLRRFFNEQPRRPHSGLDIAAPKGTPIKAPAGGEIILTGNFFFNGNAVFIDHGKGLVTMYAHMNSIEVTEGQHVKRGEKIGTVGMTGRVTGPHLHWGISLNDARVNPSLFVPALQVSSEDNSDTKM
jgi:murein DD-endopeptidase MepM/ murein hydrolase activator NlpD